MTVDIGFGKQDTIKVFDDDNPEILAK